MRRDENVVKQVLQWTTQDHTGRQRSMHLEIRSGEKHGLQISSTVELEEGAPQSWMWKSALSPMFHG